MSHEGTVAPLFSTVSQQLEYMQQCALWVSPYLSESTGLNSLFIEIVAHVMTSNLFLKLSDASIRYSL